MSAVDNMEPIACELRRLTPIVVQKLVDIPVSLTAAEELAVERLLEKAVAVLLMLEEEESAMQIALQKSDNSPAKGNRDGVIER